MTVVSIFSHKSRRMMMNPVTGSVDTLQNWQEDLDDQVRQGILTKELAEAGLASLVWVLEFGGGYVPATNEEAGVIRPRDNIVVYEGSREGSANMARQLSAHNPGVEYWYCTVVENRLLRQVAFLNGVTHR